MNEPRRTAVLKARAAGERARREAAERHERDQAAERRVDALCDRVAALLGDDPETVVHDGKRICLTPDQLEYLLDTKLPKATYGTVRA